MKVFLSTIALLGAAGLATATPVFPRNAVCTSVIFLSPEYNAGPTHTVYTTTTTATETLECGQCHAVVPSYLPLGVPPVAFINATTTAATPSTATTYVCSNPTPRPVPLPVEQKRSPQEEEFYEAPPSETITDQPPGMHSSRCTLTTQVDPIVPDSTRTVYTAGTTTETREVECGGCALVWSTGVLYFFAPVRITATATEGVSTKVDLACATPA